MASFLLRRIRAPNVTLIRRFRSSSYFKKRSRSSFSWTDDEDGKSSESSEDEPLSSNDSDLEDLYKAVDYATGSIKHIIQCQKSTGIVYKAFNVISHHSIFDNCSNHTKYKVLSRVFDQIRNYPQACKFEVFLMNAFIRSLSKDGPNSNLTKDEVISRVLDIVQSYPKVSCHEKVTEKTHFHDDLGFVGRDYENVREVLQYEFNIAVPRKEALSCQQLIDYIYDNHMNESLYTVENKWEAVRYMFLPIPVLIESSAVS